MVVFNIHEPNMPKELVLFGGDDRVRAFEASLSPTFCSIHQPICQPTALSKPVGQFIGKPQFFEQSLAEPLGQRFVHHFLSTPCDLGAMFFLLRAAHLHAIWFSLWWWCS